MRVHPAYTVLARCCACRQGGSALALGEDLISLNASSIMYTFPMYFLHHSLLVDPASTVPTADGGSARCIQGCGIVAGLSVLCACFESWCSA